MPEAPNVIYLFGEITDENCAAAAIDIITISMTPENEEPIHIYITTDGGDAMAALGLADVIQSAANKVYTYGIGKAYSAGFFVLVAGDKRYITKNTQVMIHDISYEVGGTPREIAAENASAIKASNTIMEFIKRTTKISNTYIERMQEGREDLYFSGQEVFDLGIADEYLTSIK